MSYKLEHRPCSVYQYADEQIEFWTPEESSSNDDLHTIANAKDNHTLNLWWWFPTGDVIHKEEYLIFDTMALVMFIASTLGLSIGFSCSWLIINTYEYIKNQLIRLAYDLIEKRSQEVTNQKMPKDKGTQKNRKRKRNVSQIPKLDLRKIINTH